MDNLLDKIKAILKDPRILVHRNYRWKHGLKTSKYHSSYCEYHFEIAPENGFMKIDEDSIEKMKCFQNEVFSNILSERYKIRDVSLKGCFGFPKYGIHPCSYPGLDRATENSVLWLGRIVAEEPIGLVEEFSSFENKIFPRYENEFEEKDLHEKGSSRYKHGLEREIYIHIFPSIEFLIELRNFRIRQRQFIDSRKGINNVSYEEIEKFRQEERDLGFIDIERIYVKAYNKHFENYK